MLSNNQVGLHVIQFSIVEVLLIWTLFTFTIHLVCYILLAPRLKDLCNILYLYGHAVFQSK